jgi:hypothetical protein
LAEAAPTWWDVAIAVNYLRNGVIPADPVDWSTLPDAGDEIKKINAGIRAGQISVVLVLIDDEQQEFDHCDGGLEIAISFRPQAFLGGDIGVILEVVDTRSGQRLRDVKRLFLKAEDIRALQTIRGNKEWFVWAAKNILPDDFATGWRKRYAQKLEHEMQLAAETSKSLKPVKRSHLYNEIRKIGWPKPPQRK